MRTVLAIGISALSFSSLVAGKQAAQQFQADASQQYHGEDGSTYKLEGVCTFDERHINCKTATGAENKELGRRLEDYYQQQQLGQYFQLALSFGRKNRLIVFSGAGPNGGFNLSASGDAIATSSQAVQLPGEPSMAWLLVAAVSHSKSVDMTLTPNVGRGLPPGHIEFRDGAATTYNGVTIRLGGAKPAPPFKPVPVKPGQQGDPNNVPQGEPGPHWLYLLQTDTTQSPLTNITYRALDKSGNPIEYVDRKGNAVSALTVVRDSPVPPPGYQPQPLIQYPGLWNAPQYPGPSARAHPRTWRSPLPKYRPLWFWVQFTDRSVFEIFSNLNPSEVGSIEVTGTRPYSVLFKNIPLDPDKTESDD